MDTRVTDYNQLSEDYQRIERAIRFLEQNFDHQPSLDEVAASVALSEYHFQRLFTRWVGISPKRFLQYLTKEYALLLLQKSNDVLSAAYQAGLSSPGRLHDLLVQCEAITPGQARGQGVGLEISYGLHPSPFGECLVAATGRGVCSLAFVGQQSRPAAVAALHNRWPQAEISERPAQTQALVGQIFAPFESQPDPRPLAVYLQGTNFQIKVWEALLRIPTGRVVSYEDLAVMLDRPRACRAVGQAVAHNPLPWLIPCHRVIRKGGDFGNYQGGTARKKAILGWEMAHAAGVAS